MPFIFYSKLLSDGQIRSSPIAFKQVLKFFISNEIWVYIKKSQEYAEKFLYLETSLVVPLPFAPSYLQKNRLGLSPFISKTFALTKSEIVILFTLTKQIVLFSFSGFSQPVQLSIITRLNSGMLTLSVEIDGIYRAIQLSVKVPEIFRRQLLQSHSLWKIVVQTLIGYN